MVSRARSRTAHCFGVRFRVSSRTMWSCNHRESNGIRTAHSCHESLAPTCQPTAMCSSPFFPLQFSVLKGTSQVSLTPGLRRTSRIQNTLSLERWLSSLAAVKISWAPWAKKKISRKQRTPNSIRKHGTRSGRQQEKVEGKCPYRLVSERGQNNHPFHCVHYHPPELLQDTLQDRLLTHSSEECEAVGPGNE